MKAKGLISLEQFLELTAEASGAHEERPICLDGTSAPQLLLIRRPLRLLLRLPLQLLLRLLLSLRTRLASTMVLVPR